MFITERVCCCRLQAAVPIGLPRVAPAAAGQCDAVVAGQQGFDTSNARGQLSTHLDRLTTI